LIADSVAEEPRQPEHARAMAVEGEYRRDAALAVEAGREHQLAVAAEVLPPHRGPFPGGEHVAALLREPVPVRRGLVEPGEGLESKLIVRLIARTVPRVQ
jgi:hypothetical protein